MKIIKYGWLLLALLSNLALAQVTIPRLPLDKIFKSVMRSEIPLTSKVHGQFWSELRKLPADEQADFMRIAGRAILESHAYQVEVWESALLSYNNRKIFKSGEMIRLEKTMRATMLGSLTSNLSKKTNIAAISEFDAKLKKSIYDSNLVLEAAAKHQVLRLQGVNDIEMNQDSILAIAASLKGTLNKIQRLLNPIWMEETVNDLGGDISSGKHASSTVIGSTASASLGMVDQGDKKPAALNNDPFLLQLQDAARTQGKSLKQAYDEAISRAIQDGVITSTRPH